MQIKEIIDNYTDRHTLADALGVCARTVAAYEKEGLPSILIGGRKMYPNDGVAAFLKRRERDGRHG